MDRHRSFASGGRYEYAAPSGWEVPAALVAIVVWWAFGPLGDLWLYALGWTAALTAVNGVLGLLRVRRGAAVPSPGGLVADLLRLGPESWLLAPRWARVRMAVGAFLLFAVFAAGMGWQAGKEYRLLADLRQHGRRTDAAVIRISGRSEEGRVNAVTVRFSTPTGPVQARVDIPGTSADSPQPGMYVPVVFDPAHPAEVRHLSYLDGDDAKGIRLGAIVGGLLAAGFLAGTVGEVVRARRQTETAPANGSPGTAPPE
ncbi:DUF3592 domain-containing protein [Streptomyces fuscichromogenes]|uniref:DUF3592 domain-containing protein n=1 Tax=Streptomyces fuscichromogenes TaxID=1324013 RepID=A0A917XIW0_9ACTN|nr:DUF3592 domain-containing protein [Streptomyces fuscichromogenes]GGN27844.1 hypothetical protein GCM10011578_063470 [Streptomyces fuscichromogenes]